MPLPSLRALRRQSSRVRLGALLVAGLLGAGTLTTASPVSPASAATAPMSFLQFNLCGISCGQGALAARDLEAAVTAKAPRPYVVTLQEVCRSVLTTALAALPAYRGRFEVTKAAACADGSDFGIALMVRTGQYTYLGSWWLPNPGNNEPRRIACLQTSVAGASRPLVACVTHIDNRVGNQPAQVADVAARVAAYAVDNAVVLGGDFNLSPPNAALDAVYDSDYPSGRGTFVEADSGNLKRSGGSATSAYLQWTNCKGGAGCPSATNPTYRKPDLLFLTARDFTGYSGSVQAASGSDHLVLRADAVLG